MEDMIDWLDVVLNLNQAIYIKTQTFGEVTEIFTLAVNFG